MKLLIVVISCAVAAFAKHHGSKAAKKAFPFNDYLEGRIADGQIAEKGQFPWQVELFSDRSNFCGGALISNEWILTAAHCIYGKSSFKLTFGAIRIFEDDPGTIRKNSSESYCHPLFDPKTFTHDVGLIKLADPVTFDELIQKITLAESNSFLDEDVPVKASGWGSTGIFQWEISRNLLWVDLTSMTNAQCGNWYLSEFLEDNVVCCIGKGKKSTCIGDSGGALIQCNNDDCIHVGVVSFGLDGRCQPGVPSGFSRTAHAIEFINNVTGLNFP